MRISDWSSYVCSSDLVGHAVDDDRRAADAVAFVADFFIVGAVGAARAALDGALDVVFGHVGVGGLVPGHAQPRIAVRVGAAGPRRDGDLTNDFGPELDRKSTRLNSSH